MSEKNTYSVLLDQIQNDNIAAYNELYKQFYAPLCIFAGRYITESKLAEDCVQDVFLKIWKDRKSISVSISVRSYLVTAVKNNCLNILRKKKLELNYEQYILNTYDEYNAGDLYSVEELQNMIDRAIERLPEKFREVFLMSRFEQLTYREIADKKNISVKTVEAHMHKALSLLSIELKDFLSILLILTFFQKK